MNLITQRALGLAWMLFLVAMGIAIAVASLLFIYRETPPFESSYKDVRLVNRDTVATDNFALISIERCSKSESPIGLVSMVSLEYQGTHDVILPVSATAYQQRHGCTTTFTRYHVPSNVLDRGAWRIVGVDIVVGNQRAQQNVLWASETFVVD